MWQSPDIISSWIEDFRSRLEQETDGLTAELSVKLSTMESIWHAVDEATMIAMTDEYGRIQHVNDTFMQVSGYTHTELYGETFQKMNSSYHDEAFYQDLWHTLKRGENWSGEIRNQAKDGTLYWVKTTIFPIEPAPGEAVVFVAVQSDITQGKRREEREAQARKTAEAAAEKSIWQEPLTGLPNRRALEEELPRWMEHHSACGLLILDMDRFAQVNDVYGHRTGDQLIMAAAERLQLLQMREKHTTALYHLGGDEFALVYAGNREAGAAAVYGVMEQLESPVFLHDGAFRQAASIGIAEAEPEDSEAEVLQKAGAALMSAKRSGGRQWKWYDPGLQRKQERRMWLERALPEAVSAFDDHFHVFYQPIVEASTSRVMKWEALLRWEHPEEWISPAEFIETAEYTGLIKELGMRTLKRVLDDRRSDPGGAAAAVNVSSIQLQDPAFPRMVLTMLEAAGVEPASLEFELTESVFMQMQGQIGDSIRRLKEAGIRLSLDDFGTGFSSLAYIKDFPVDTIKLDKSFVQELPDNTGDKAVTLAVLQLADTLGMMVTAEGIETDRQAAFFRGFPGVLLQGYYFSRPMSVEEKKDWVVSGR
ncbi:putative bifunctional diguanylate cyclase/phosphodiesterase [Alkalicoccus chagannorensis]|uniref:putative bifunctional diguanylate cyclase/phosphodiesterase n=1 Tax=Alkalicoccus chagannorensis TaxID=427072 RepID=UPI0004042556|nr:GGDEF domain-containing phosphodiesterase [Alkalicoccus chagannorensis]